MAHGIYLLWYHHRNAVKRESRDKGRGWCLCCGLKRNILEKGEEGEPHLSLKNPNIQTPNSSGGKGSGVEKRKAGKNLKEWVPENF